MNKTLLSRLVIGALATIAAGGAMAGQIQASSVSIAREVITTDTQAVVAPSIAYRFFGDVDARVQTQTFQVQFILEKGEWAAAPTANAFSVSDGVSGVIQDQSVNAPVAPANASYQVIATNVGSSDPINNPAKRDVVWATISVNQGATALIKQPLISVNVTANTINGAPLNVSAARGTVDHLSTTVVGNIVDDFLATGFCEGVRTLAVSFKHYVALIAPGSMATDQTATPDENVRSGSTNTATLMTFPTNILVKVPVAAGNVSLTAGSNQTFFGTAPAFVDPNNALLGNVNLFQSSSGYDSNLSNIYALAAGPGLSGVPTALVNNGPVEVRDVKVTVSASNGFVVGGTLALNTAANCAVPTRVPGTAIVPITAANAAGPIDLVVATANVNAAFGATGAGPVYVCYTNPGNVTIPSSQFSAVARVEKAVAGAPFNEQDNICKGTYISLGGGIKIDVRNYASVADQTASGYQSVVRLINTSDTKTADVWGQIIHQDGKFGGYGQIATLAPRQILNMTNAQIEAKLTIAPAAAVGQNGATAATTSANGSPRLRITSNAGDTLRVQNYLFNLATGQFQEASGSQAVDFAVPNVQRAPANDGQYISQDAQSGLNGAQ